jgi:hypothetical protein
MLTSTRRVARLTGGFVRVTIALEWIGRLKHACYGRLGVEFCWTSSGCRIHGVIVCFSVESDPAVWQTAKSYAHYLEAGGLYQRFMVIIDAEEDNCMRCAYNASRCE